MQSSDSPQDEKEDRDQQDDVKESQPLDDLEPAADLGDVTESVGDFAAAVRQP